MLDLQQTQTIRTIIHSLLEQCDVSYKVPPFDHNLYQACLDEAKRRGYPVDGDVSARTYLQEGVAFATIVAGHITHHPTQIWIALFTSVFGYVEDASACFLSAIPDIYLFNDRFIGKERQGDAMLNALADLVYQAPALFQPIPSNLIVTSAMNYVTANLLEYETTSMQISGAAKRYATYQRTMTGVAEAYAYMLFPREVPFTEYIQAIPDMILLINNINDVMSFYKEELVGETTNQVSTLAAQSGKSKLETLHEIMEASVCLYKDIARILSGSPAACEAFKSFAAGLILFHFAAAKRYKLADLDL